MTRLTYTYTRTSVYDHAPCGCRVRIPNEAYAETVTLDCEHGYHYEVRVEEKQERGIWVPRTTWQRVCGCGLPYDANGCPAGH